MFKSEIQMIQTNESLEFWQSEFVSNWSETDASPDIRISNLK